ncbi:MAG: 23S rRNA (guanosine(2251)-2'-O)-methyltransferase RlmB [Sandaracinaceae bacterium]
MREILKRAPSEVQALYFAPPGRDGREIHAALDDAKRAGVRAQERSDAELAGLAGPDHGGLVAVVGPYPYADAPAELDEHDLVVALDQITDPHNLGAIVRSAAAFGAGWVLVPRDRSASVDRVVVRAAAGATERVRIARVTNLARTLGDLRDGGAYVVGLDAGGSLAVDDVPKRSGLGRVLVVGAEGSGLRRLVRERCDALARIPMHGDTESLNASVAAAIALYAMTRG